MELCRLLRARLIDTVSRTGGHLASSLGAVELIVAIHRVFDTGRDRLVFDVGHQCYAHKILTGRNQAMETLRTFAELLASPNRWRVKATPLSRDTPLTQYRWPLEWQGQEHYNMRTIMFCVDRRRRLVWRARL